MTAISVVICTIENSGREQRLAEVIRRLRGQTGVEADIILVWQGSEESLPAEFRDVDVLITGLCSSGASRNRGARAGKHEFIAFFDDDTYPVDADFLKRAVGLLDAHKLDFLTCNIQSDGGTTSGSRISADIDLGPRTLIGNMWEPGLVVRRAAFAATGFDETLGIGCVHGSSEGFDFGARLIAGGFRGRRFAALVIDHPPLEENLSAERSFFYSLGNGATLIQRRYYRTYAWQLAKSAGRLAIGLLTLDRTTARNSWIRLLSMLAGPFLPRRPARLVPPGQPSAPPRLIPRRETPPR